MKREKYLIAGATGFIGSAIVRELVSRGLDVSSLIRPESNIWRLPKHSSRHHLVQGDLTDLTSLQKTIKEINPNHIFNLATYGVYRDQDDKDLILRSNVLGTENLLKAALNVDLTSFVNTGSVYEYADLPGCRIESILGTPRNPYDTAKIKSTHLACEFAKDYQLPVCTLRLFTTFGPYEDVRRLVSRTIFSFLNDKSFTISSSPVRDFVYLADVVTAYLRASSIALKQGEVINIGSGQPTRVGDLVNKLVKIINPKVLPQVTDQFAPINDSQCWADVSLAKKLLGWSPVSSLDQSLEETVDWFRTNKKLYTIQTSPRSL